MSKGIEGFEKIMAYGGIMLTSCQEPPRQFKHLRVLIVEEDGEYGTGGYVWDTTHLGFSAWSQVVLPLFQQAAIPQTGNDYSRLTGERSHNSTNGLLPDKKKYATLVLAGKELIRPCQWEVRRSFGKKMPDTLMVF